MTSLILKALRPIVVPLIVEAMEQHHQQQAASRIKRAQRDAERTTQMIYKDMARIINGDGKGFGAGPARY